MDVCNASSWEETHSQRSKFFNGRISPTSVYLKNQFWINVNSCYFFKLISRPWHTDFLLTRFNSKQMKKLQHEFLKHTIWSCMLLMHTVLSLSFIEMEEVTPQLLLYITCLLPWRKELKRGYPTINDIVHHTFSHLYTQLEKFPLKKQKCKI